MNAKPTTRAELLAAAQSNPTAVALADQFGAALSEVIAVAPENQGKSGGAMVERAVRFALDHVSDPGPARAAVLRIHETDIRMGAAEFDRPAGDFALPQTAVAARCNVCSESYGRMVPFWYPCGSLIVQIDACPSCAEHLIRAGHRPRHRQPVPDWA